MRNSYSFELVENGVKDLANGVLDLGDTRKSGMLREDGLSEEPNVIGKVAGVGLTLF
ncbi:MAG: hypothetical protein RMJ98_09355 [Myxococcales bacterium]|nr:hypothetical protein [Polyangiaceae bacterium]MDW8249493.1 hypothetical protein [Myxococcales bacterium]